MGIVGLLLLWNGFGLVYLFCLVGVLIGLVVGCDFDFVGGLVLFAVIVYLVVVIPLVVLFGLNFG